MRRRNGRVDRVGGGGKGRGVHSRSLASSYISFLLPFTMFRRVIPRALRIAHAEVEVFYRSFYCTRAERLLWFSFVAHVVLRDEGRKARIKSIERNRLPPLRASPDERNPPLPALRCAQFSGYESPLTSARKRQIVCDCGTASDDVVELDICACWSIFIMGVCPAQLLPRQVPRSRTAGRAERW
jgi:hypothetical protein